MTDQQTSALAGHLIVALILLFVGSTEASGAGANSTRDSRRMGARLVLLALVWEVWVLWGLWHALCALGRGISRLWALADWGYREKI